RSVLSELQGSLIGFDQTTNLILQDSKERVFQGDEPTQDLPLGLYLVRGDSSVSVSLVDKEKDDEIDWAQLQAAPLKAMTHGI
ncbi:hypothetical protein HDU91_003342, partial [Kappamyces sp. JEL0680]